MVLPSRRIRARFKVGSLLIVGCVHCREEHVDISDHRTQCVMVSKLVYGG
ncbi:BQ5605_C002g01710 [Microbotryum silenes-dioicae]|uniref:BQ5605_C002g01710 protein n=1 Tax=Microbotryum silenes-dioicae TaxID=796604 RepID=A0A2X0M3W6_9BASI|nr:BQ5605_C002g01710 [Microbotryum silenes-dioicae]